VREGWGRGAPEALTDERWPAAAGKLLLAEAVAAACAVKEPTQEGDTQKEDRKLLLPASVGSAVAALKALLSALAAPGAPGDASSPRRRRRRRSGAVLPRMRWMMLSMPSPLVLAAPGTVIEPLRDTARRALPLAAVRRPPPAAPPPPLAPTPACCPRGERRGDTSTAMRRRQRVGLPGSEPMRLPPPEVPGACPAAGARPAAPMAASASMER
jgi:hypothetical protein